jgi:acetyl-CoA synthetase
MLHKYLKQTTFTSNEDFRKNFKIEVPEIFNFGYDIIDGWAEKAPQKLAMLWTNDKGEERRYTFSDIKQYTDQTASYFQTLGIGKGDKVMLV